MTTWSTFDSLPGQTRVLDLLETMSASMRDWIGPLVESELKAALGNFERAYVPGQRVEEGHRVCGPDTVTVHVKKGQEVQIIEVSCRLPIISTG